MDSFEKIKTGLEYIILLGAGIMSLAYGIKRIYRAARSVDTILEHVVDEKEARSILATELSNHIKHEETMDAKRDEKLVEMNADLQDIAREIRPNGGSSIKDTINYIASDLGDINARLARVEQWKQDYEE